MDWKNLLFSADGRIGRQTFWIGWLILLGVNVVLSWIPFLGFLISLAALYCSICVFSKRLHDMGKSGWLQLVPILLGPVLLIGAGAWMAIGAMTAGANGGDPGVGAMAGLGGAVLAMILAVVVSIGFTIWVGVTPSQVGENRYGPQPLTPVVV